MVDLPIPTTCPAAATAPAAANSSLRGASARDGGAPADDDAFHAVLAQELGLLPGGPALPGTGAPAATAKPDAATQAGLKLDEDAAQTAAASDAAGSPACIGMIPIPPSLAGTSIAWPATAGWSQMPAGSAPASAGCVSAALDARQNRLATDLAAARTESQSAAEQVAANSAAPGKFLPGTTTDDWRETPFDHGLAERHQAPPLAAAAIHAHTATPAQFTAEPAATVAARLGQHGWDQALGDKLVWMAGQSQQTAQLHLNPPELGPLQITLTLDHDQASAQFVSAHALVRDAIEAAMPRLREMLADNGITLGDTSVSADAFREQAQPQQQQQRAYTAPPALPMADSGVVRRGTQWLQPSRGLVDTFA